MIIAVVTFNIDKELMIKDQLQEVEAKEDKKQDVEEMKNIYIRRETYESRLLKLG